MTSPPPLTVYLDSSDYSRLSHPKPSPEIARTRDRLIELAGLPSVAFVYSGAHLSEMAPLEAKYTDAASARANLLVALCGRNALVAFPTLIEAEVDCLRRLESNAVAAITPDGTWFPDTGQMVSPVKWVDAMKAVNEKAAGLGFNRKQRRMLTGKVMKHGKPRPGVLKGPSDIDLDSIVERYPMRRQDAEVLLKYALGKATAEQADEAFLESLRDPTWMMRWFQEHHDRLGPINELVRSPARKMAAMAEKVRESAARLTELDVGGELFTASGWKKVQDDVLLRVANSSMAERDPSAAPCTDAALVDRYCPGVATCMRVIISSVRNSIGKGARKHMQSDFVDAAHAMYAPYVSFFRADRYMAPIIQTHVLRYGTVVVAKLEDLPDRIEAALAGRPDGVH